MRRCNGIRTMRPLAVLGLVLVGAFGASAQVELTALAPTYGGGTVQNDAFIVRGAVGPTAIGISSNATYGVGSGFWFATRDKVTIGLEGEPGGDIPETYQLEQNYPNPFNPATTLRFGLPEPAHVRIEVYNVLGQRVRVLLDVEKPAGYHEVQWDGRINGAEAPTGLYLYRMATPAFVHTRKMLLVR